MNPVVPARHRDESRRPWDQPVRRRAGTGPL